MSLSVRLCVLSDTHGRLPQEVVKFCEGADYILHAGDVGSDFILPTLENIAPLICVLGNVDVPGLAAVRSKITLAGWRIMVQHVVWRQGELSLEFQELLRKNEADLVVFGHTHRPLCKMVDEVVFFNPGSCGPKRFELPRTVGEVILNASGGWFRIFALGTIGNVPPLIESRFEFPLPSERD